MRKYEINFKNKELFYSLMQYKHKEIQGFIDSCAEYIFKHDITVDESLISKIDNFIANNRDAIFTHEIMYSNLFMLFRNAFKEFNFKVINMDYYSEDALSYYLTFLRYIGIYEKNIEIIKFKKSLRLKFNDDAEKTLHNFINQYDIINRIEKLTESKGINFNNRFDLIKNVFN